MALPADYLSYPQRQRGMDHDLYDWSILPRRPLVEWPGRARLALWVVPSLEWFPLDMGAAPFRPLGGLERPYPDYWNYTHRDYGLRVGIFRLMKVLDDLGIRATAAVNAAVCRRYPAVIEAGLARRWEFVAHGLDMGQVHHAGLSRTDEARMVGEALATVRRATGQAVRGWLSPGHTHSLHTLDLLGEHGVEYVCDWVNDDLPYRMRAAGGRLFSMPYAHELSDATIIWQYHHTAEEFRQQIEDQFELLYREAARSGGRVLALSLRPWIIGQPHRIQALARALAHVMSRAGIWAATGSEILDAFRTQQA